MLDVGCLSSNAVSAIHSAKAVRVSPISIFEITRKVRVGKWPEMAPYVSTLADQIAARGAISATQAVIGRVVQIEDATKVVIIVGDPDQHAFPALTVL